MSKSLLKRTPIQIWRQNISSSCRNFAMDDYESQSAAFVQDFESQKGATFHPSIKLTDLRHQHAGRGIIATAEIPADTELFTIPRRYVISVENSRLSEQVPQIFGEQVNDLDGNNEENEDEESLPKPWLNLILVLIHDYFHYSTSKWRAYWDVLPHSFDTLMFWTDQELAELQASAVSRHIGKDSANKMFMERVIPIVQRHEDVFYPAGTPRLSNDELLNLSHRMGSLIMAYAFDLETSNEDSDEEAEDGWAEDHEGQMAMGMVPMADMLNADAEFNAHLEHGTENLTMRSLRPIQKGEEVLNYYGPLPNCDLLRRYGYTSPKHSRHDVVELSWSTISQTIQNLFGPSQPSIQPDELEDTFVLERESSDPDETGQHTSPAKFTTLPEELVEQATTFIGSAIEINPQGKLSDHQKQKLKHSFLKVMQRCISVRLAEYDTTIERDEEILLQFQTENNGRLKMAVDVRLGEKRLLSEAAVLVGDLLVKYADVEMGGMENEEERPAKRQKKSR